MRTYLGQLERILISTFFLSFVVPMRSEFKKILIIRLSSIGDVILTSPIVRSLKRCYPDAELHFITKAAYASLLDENPLLEKVHRFEGDMNATIAELKAEGFDFILDLHRNLRSRIIKTRLRLPASTYSKDRWSVLLHTKFKMGQLPNIHTVERYGRALKSLDCELDGEPSDVYLPPEAHSLADQIRNQHFSQPPVGVVLGGTFATKRWPAAYFIELLNKLGQPVLLLGGPAEKEDAAQIKAGLKVHHLDAVGQYDLVLSAALVKQCRYLITHDTGLMHIGAAFAVPLFVLWGNTVPELGFYPWQAEAVNLQVEGLKCRPCTKLGHDKCPKGHFKCMLDLKPEQVLDAIEAWEAGNSGL